MNNRKGLWLPDEILALTNLSPAVRMVLGQVCYRAARNEGICSDTNAEIAAAVHVHPQTVSDALKFLTGSSLLHPVGGINRSYEPRARLVSLYIRSEDGDRATPTHSSVIVTATGVTSTQSLTYPPSANGLPSVNGLSSAVDLPPLSQRLNGGKSTAYAPSAVDLPLYIGIEKYKTSLKELKQGRIQKNGREMVDEPPVSPALIDGESEEPPLVAAAPPDTPAAEAEPAPKAPAGLPPAPPTRRGDPFLRNRHAEDSNIPFSKWFAAYGQQTAADSCKALWINLTDEERQKAWEHTPLYLKAEVGFIMRPFRYLTDKHFNCKIIDRHAANAETRAGQGGEVLPARVYTKQSFRRDTTSGDAAV